MILDGSNDFTSEQLREFLMEMEDQIRIPIFTGNCVGPKFLHEEHLVGELRQGS